jgi:hypothetical protein
MNTTKQLAGYRARLTVIGEGDTAPFKNTEIDAIDEAQAWDKACAWFENVRPWNYKPLELVLMKGEEEVRKQNF